MRPLFRRLSYEHVAIPGRHNRSTSTSQGSSDMSRFRFTSRMRTILSFDLISPNSPGRSPSIASGVVCNQPSMNGNRAHLGSAAALEPAPGGVLCLVENPYQQAHQHFPASDVSGPDVTDVRTRIPRSIGSGVAGAILWPGRRSTAPHAAPNRHLFGLSGQRLNRAGHRGPGSVCSERAVCPASLTLGADRSGPSIVRR